MAESAVRVVVSPTLSEDYDRRYVVVDATTGAIVDDAQGYGYKTAQNAHRAHAYKSVSPAKKSQREAIKKSVRRWRVEHSDGCVQQSGVRVGDDPGHRRVVAE